MSRVITFNRTGGPEVLEFVDIQVPAPTADEVQIRVHALGVNRAEIMYRNGQYVIDPKFPARLGYEAAGVVQSVGKNVKEFTNGDLVSVIPSFMFDQYGMYGELVNAPAHAVVKHPENLSFEEAAASWMMYTTAYGALVEYGNLQAGQNIIIRAASSSVGLAAIQIANMLGANPLALTRTAEKKEMLLKAGAVAVISTAEQDIVTEINRVTNDTGAHIVFDPVGGPDVAKLTQVMAPHGMFFQYGALDSRDMLVPVFEILGKHLTLRGYELFEITMDSEKMMRAKSFITKGLQSGKLKPIIDKTFPFEEIANAQRYMEENGQVGKIVVTVK